MFSRRKKVQADASAIPSVRGGSVGGVSGPTTGQEFWIGLDPSGLSTDPKSGWQAYTQQGTYELLLFRPGGGSVVTVNILSLPRDSWVAVDDQDGRRTPLEICWKAKGIAGRWVILIGGDVSPDTDADLTALDRRQMADQAEEASRADHQRAMRGIDGIR